MYAKPNNVTGDNISVIPLHLPVPSFIISLAQPLSSLTIVEMVATVKRFPGKLLPGYQL